MRKMASVQRVLEKKSIVGADLIEAYRVNGWWVVDKKGAYEVGDLVVYCEVDSWIPHTLAPFLTKPGHYPREYLGVEGERLRTVKLKGQLSQGLLLPLVEDNSEEGQDFSEILGITKWEDTRYMANMDARGNFPDFIPKTDQERVQNLDRTLEKYFGQSFEVTVKRDGSSLTAFVNGEESGVCSRNVNLKETEDSAFWAAANSLSCAMTFPFSLP